MKNKLSLNLIISSILIFAFGGSLLGSFLIAKEANKVEYIKSEEDFEKVRNNLSGHFILSPDSDINISNNWIPIGTAEHPFSGYFEGNFHGVNLSEGFSKEYAESASDSDLYLGLFGFNVGIIKHLNVRYFNPITDNLLSHNYSNIVFGGVCCFNSGYITGCTSSFSQLNLSTNFSKSTIGGIVGVNNGQIQGCTYNSHFSITSEIDINSGCICGIADVNSVIKYCYRSGYVFYTLYGRNNNVGYCVGLCRGGSFENIGFSFKGNSFNPLRMRLYDRDHPSFADCGVLIGFIDALQNIFIDRTVIDFFSEDVYVDNLNFGFLCGRAKSNGHSIIVNNCCCSGKIFNLRSDSKNNFGMIGVKDDASMFKITNSFCYDLNYNTSYFDLCDFIESSYSSLSIKTLHLDEAVWIKGTYNFFLNYEKKIY